VPVKEKISYSELSDWNLCPYKRKLVYDDKNYSDGSIHTYFGTAVHEAAEYLVKDNSVDGFQIFSDKYDELIEDVKFEFTEKEYTRFKSSTVKEVIEVFREYGRAIIPEILPAMTATFGEYEVIGTEYRLFEDIEGFPTKFKGLVDLVIKSNGRYCVLDWKTCGWGWDAEKKADKMTNYQIVLYKKYIAQKLGLDLNMLDTYFGLLKKSGKPGKYVEIFKSTSGKKRTSNATELLSNCLKNINSGFHVKNRLSCNRPLSRKIKFNIRCQFYKTDKCK